MFKNIVNTFFTRVFGSLSNLVIAILISNVFGAEVKGEQGLILTTITLVSLVTAVIGAGSIVYLLPRTRTLHLLVPSYVWNAIICISVYSILTQSQILPDEFILHTCLLTFVLTLSHIHCGILIGIEKIKQSNLSVLLNTLAVLLALIFFTYYLEIDNINAYIYSLYCGYSINLLLSIYFILSNWKSKLRILSPADSSFLSATLRLLKYGFLNQLDNLAQMLSFRLSYYFINYFITRSAVGIYSNAISIIESIWLISRSISMVQNARIANSSDIAYSLKITLNLLKVSFLIVLCAVIVLLFIPAGFYQFVFGEEFGDIRIVIVSISPGILLFSTSFILSGLYAGTGNYHYNTIASILGLAITIALAFLLIPNYGLAGAGITASVSYIASVVVKFFILVKIFKVKPGEMLISKHDINYFIQLVREKK